MVKIVEFNPMGASTRFKFDFYNILFPLKIYLFLMRGLNILVAI